MVERAAHQYLIQFTIPYFCQSTPSPINQTPLHNEVITSIPPLIFYHLTLKSHATADATVRICCTRELRRVILPTSPVVESAVIPEERHGWAAPSLRVDIHVHDSHLGKLRVEAEPVLHGVIRDVGVVADSNTVMVEHVELYSDG